MPALFLKHSIKGYVDIYFLNYHVTYILAIYPKILPCAGSIWSSVRWYGNIRVIIIGVIEDPAERYLAQKHHPQKVLNAGFTRLESFLWISVNKNKPGTLLSVPLHMLFTSSTDVCHSDTTCQQNQADACTIQKQITMLSLYCYIDSTNLYDFGNFYKVNPKIMHLSVIYTKGHVCKHELFYISIDLMDQLNDGYANI